MAQDQRTGAAGNEFGRENAKRLAKALGATLTKPGSNEARLNGKLVALKSAAVHTNSIGVTYLMLDRVEEIIAALERPDGSFELYALPVAEFRSSMKPTRSKGPSSGRVGIVRRVVFEQRGLPLGTRRL